MQNEPRQKSGRGIPKAGTRAPGGGRKPEGDQPKDRTTVTLSVELLGAVRRDAALQKKSVSELVEAALLKIYET